MSYENFVFATTGFMPATKLDTKDLKNVNRLIIDVMSRRGFSPNETDAFEVEYVRPSFAMTFGPTVFKADPIPSEKVASALHLKGKNDLAVSQFHRKLMRTIDEHPNKISFVIHFVEFKGEKGYQLRIESEPTILAKNRALHSTLEIAQSNYERIITYNIRDLKEIIGSIPYFRFEEPRVLKPRDFRVRLFTDSKALDIYPQDVASCLKEADKCFAAEIYLPCAVMLRKAIDVAVSKKFQQEGKQLLLFDKENNEYGLDTKLNKLANLLPRLRRDVEQMRMVKWLGDKAAHDPTFVINPSDIRDNIPRVVAFLDDIQLRS